MRVGTIKETKTEEYRVGLTPAGAQALVAAGHEVLVERGAGIGSECSNEAYERAGAKVVASAADVAGNVDLLVKVKEIVPQEYSLLRPGLVLFTYLHLASEPELTGELLKTRTNAIAYEAVQEENGSLPLLIPMSQVAGRMAGEIAAKYLNKPGFGRGKLLGGIVGVSPARAVVLGSGSVGTAAAQALVALGARVTVTSRDRAKLSALEASLSDGVSTRVTSPSVLAEELAGADILIGAVLVPGTTTPKLVSREMVRSMGEGAVIVDIGINEGGVCETSRLTSHSDPIYVEEGVIHYCVPNIPAAAPRTSTEALTGATLPYVLELADRGLDALRDDPSLAAGAVTINGKLTSKPVADALGLEYTALELAL